MAIYSDFFDQQFLSGHAATDAVFECVSSWLCCSWNHSLYYMWSIQVSTASSWSLWVIQSNRGQGQMMDVVNNEMNSWPVLVQEAIGYLQTSAVVIPLIILLWSVIQHACVPTYYMFHNLVSSFTIMGDYHMYWRNLTKIYRSSLFWYASYSLLFSIHYYIFKFRNAGKHEHELLKVNNWVL